jgi:uncharacterized protein (UPF0332 family)
MPHQAADKIVAWLAAQGAGSPASYALDAQIVLQAKQELAADAKGLLYSSTISFLSALEGAKSAQFSWAIVKLYYAAFYAARSILGSNGTCIFYHGTKPHSVTLTPGAQPKKENGVTHKVVWSVFAREFPGNILLNDIATISAHVWMTHLRETANYKNARFPDPVVPQPFAMLDAHGVDTALQAYRSDSTHLLTFDPDHAAIAFPLECIIQALRAIERSGDAYDDDELEYIRLLSSKIGIDPSLIL